MPHKDPTKRAAYRKQLLAKPEQKAKARVRARAYYHANPEKVKRYQVEYRKRNPEAYRKTRLKGAYGAVPPEPTCCDACKRPFSGHHGSCVDHDHATGVVRGWLCNNCNIALGHVQDSRDRLQLLIVYLDKAELCR